MAPQETAMLFLPPQPPLALRTSPIVMGRSRSCDLRLPSGDASRRHAEIAPVTGGYLLRDLESTNGTFVNGERVDQRQLRPGDRIRIGSDTILFCQVGAALDPASGEDQTVLAERPVAGESFQGDLAEIPPYAVLQILELGRKTGLLEIDSELDLGRLWLLEGAPVHAETRGQRGFDAAIAIANATTGRFAFDPHSDPPEETINASVTQLLLEASRAADEAENAKAAAG
jgi:predicted component of type VI protein secretion system